MERLLRTEVDEVLPVLLEDLHGTGCVRLPPLSGSPAASSSQADIWQYPRI